MSASHATTTSFRHIRLLTRDPRTGEQGEFRFGTRDGKRIAVLAVGGEDKFVLPETAMRTVARHWGHLATEHDGEFVPVSSDSPDGPALTVCRWRGLDVIALIPAAGEAGDIVLIERRIWEAAALEGWTTTCPHCARTARSQAARRTPKRRATNSSRRARTAAQRRRKAHR